MNLKSSQNRWILKQVGASHLVGQEAIKAIRDWRNSYYAQNSAAFKKARDKYTAKIKAEKLANGLILTKEQKITKRLQTKKSNLAKALAKYANNTDGFADAAKKAYRDRYASDPELRANKLEYLRGWRKRKKEANTKKILVDA